MMVKLIAINKMPTCGATGLALGAREAMRLAFSFQDGSIAVNALHVMVQAYVVLGSVAHLLVAAYIWTGKMPILAFRRCVHLDDVAFHLFGAAAYVERAFDLQAVELGSNQPGCAGAFQPPQRFPVDGADGSRGTGRKGSANAPIAKGVVAGCRHWIDEGIVANGTEQVRIRFLDIDERVHVKDASTAVLVGEIEGGQMRRPHWIGAATGSREQHGPGPDWKRVCCCAVDELVRSDNVGVRGRRRPYEAGDEIRCRRTAT
jgi:hypothetical protein